MTAEWNLRLLAIFASLQFILGFVTTDSLPLLGKKAFARRRAASNAAAYSGRDHGGTTKNGLHRVQGQRALIPQQRQMTLSPKELSQQKSEALQSLSDFNDGTWSGRATSFSITSDTAAGVTKRKWSRPYRTSVSTRYGLGGDGLKMVETFEWTNGNGGAEEGGEEESTCVATRTVPLGRSTDVDAVDGSYSVDVALLDLPSALSGTDMLVKFAVEQSIAASDDERVRCFLLYGMDDRLARIVICDETRVEEGGSDNKDTVAYTKSDFARTSLSEDEEIAADVERIVNKITGEKVDESPEPPPTRASVVEPITAQSGVEERMKRLQRAFADAKNRDGGGGNSALENDKMQNERYPMDMFSLSLGVWLGDAVVRDHHVSNKETSPGSISKGFASSMQPRKPKKETFGDGFAEWIMGIQKLTMTFKWDFEDTVRQVMHFGRSMGASTGAVPVSSMGTINDELMSRRLKPDERMLYIDYDIGKYAGFCVGSVYIKAPRFLTFSRASNQDPFFTEFSVFQRKIDESHTMDIGDSEELPEAFCSRMTRLYDKDGQLAQGSTSFFVLKPITP